MKSKFNWKSVQNLISSVVQTLVSHTKGLKIIQSCQSVRVEKDWEIEFSFSIVFSILQYKHKIGFSEEISTP